MYVEASETVARPVTVVWDFCAVNHGRNHPRWDPDIRLEQTSGGAVAPGTVFKRWNSRFGAPTEGTMEVVDFEPGKLMTTRIQDGEITTNGRFALEPDGPDRTILTIGGEFPGMDESMADKVRPFMQRSSQAIKELIESETG